MSFSGQGMRSGWQHPWLDGQPLNPVVGLDGHSASEEGKEKRQKNTQDDGGRQRKMKGEVATANHDVAWKPAKRNPDEHQQTQCRDSEADKDQRFTHSRPARPSPTGSVPLN